MTDNVFGIEIIAAWDGPAEHAPGVLIEDSAGDGTLSGGLSMTELASWVALSAATGILGNAAYAGVRAKVLGVLSAWRYREGQEALDDLQRRVFEELNRHRAAGRLTEDELRERIAKLFADTRG